MDQVDRSHVTKADDSEPDVPDQSGMLLLGRPASISYFKEASRGYGAAHLTAKAVLGDGSRAAEMDREDVSMFMSVAHFVSTISRPQREQFAEVLAAFTIFRAMGRRSPS